MSDYDYELYVCGNKCGCKTLLEFDAHGDMQAADIAKKKIADYEEESGDYIYRQYLYRNDEDGRVDIAI